MMPTAKAWNEEVAYVDCPACDETIELGSGLVWSGHFEEECPKCHVVFEVEAP